MLVDVVFLPVEVVVTGYVEVNVLNVEVDVEVLVTVILYVEVNMALVVVDEPVNV